jgi:hypothetical protein
LHHNVIFSDHTPIIIVFVVDPPSPIAVNVYVVGVTNVGVVNDPAVPLILPPAIDTEVAFVDDQLITAVPAYQAVGGVAVITKVGVGTDVAESFFLHPRATSDNTSIPIVPMWDNLFIIPNILSQKIRQLWLDTKN